MSHEEYKKVANRVVGIFDGVGKAPRKLALAQDTALVEMMAIDVKDGILTPPSFLQHPPHLPDGDDLRVLCQGNAPKDQQLRIDAHEWASINKRESARAMVSLRNAVTAVRLANDILNDPDADENVHGWMREIGGFLMFAFGCDAREAPHARDELDLWCYAIANKANPCPEWLQYFGRATVAAKPKQVSIGQHALAGGRDDD
jgi:hypothetical protein